MSKKILFPSFLIFILILVFSVVWNAKITEASHTWFTCDGSVESLKKSTLGGGGGCIVSSSKLSVQTDDFFSDFQDTLTSRELDFVSGALKGDPLQQLNSLFRDLEIGINDVGSFAVLVGGNFKAYHLEDYGMQKFQPSPQHYFQASTKDLSGKLTGAQGWVKDLYRSITTIPSAF